jgi:WD repeat-containing protein 92
MIDHLTKSTNYTPYDVKWIPDSSKFVVCGERPRATGLIEITQLTKGELKVVSTIEHNRGVKSGSFAASPSSHTCFAFGDLEGKLSILDLEKEKVFWQVQAHTKVVNSVDGAGAEGHGYGPCEIVSGGRDGSVRVWDPRQKTPVISLDPAESDVVPDCWSVRYCCPYLVLGTRTTRSSAWWLRGTTTGT